MSDFPEDVTADLDDLDAAESDVVEIVEVVDEIDLEDEDGIESEVVEIEAVQTRVLDVDDEDGDEPRDVEAAAYGDGALFAVAPAGGVAALATLPEPEVTGDARVDAATARLGELVDLPASDHVGVYEDVHRRLQDALADAEVT